MVISDTCICFSTGWTYIILTSSVVLPNSITILLHYHVTDMAMPPSARTESACISQVRLKLCVQASRAAPEGCSGGSGQPEYPSLQGSGSCKRIMTHWNRKSLLWPPCWMEPLWPGLVHRNGGDRQNSWWESHLFMIKDTMFFSIGNTRLKIVQLQYPICFLL